MVYTLLLIDRFCVLRMKPEYGDEEIEVPLGEIPYLLRLTHAMCYYTIQGRTIRDKHILLFDTAHPHFCRRTLIVGLSRVTHGKNVHVVADETEILGREWSLK